MRYYDLSRNWTRRIVPHLNDPEVQHALITDFNKFTFGRWERPFVSGRLPYEFESCDWDIHHRGKRPQFWKYVKHAACHWLVNFTLELAQRAVPREQWRILTSVEHSTVWDGKQTLFDFNFNAMGIPPDECFQMANVEMLPIGAHLVVHFAEHFSVDVEKQKKKLARQKLLIESRSF